LLKFKGSKLKTSLSIPSP